MNSISILSSVGLDEGNLFLRKCAHLSEGQKFRMRLALHLSQEDGNVIFIDEFNAFIDRVTAKAIAKSLSKVIKRNNICLILCCNDMEIAQAFDMDSLVTLGYDKQIQVSYPENNNRTGHCDIVLHEGGRSDYESFKRYHYLDVSDRLKDGRVIVAEVNGEKVGVNVFVSPLSARRERLHPYFKLINSVMATSYRTVIHPEFRGCGIGKKLAIDGPRLLGYEIVDDRSTLYNFVKIPIYWGYTEYQNPYFRNRPHYDALETYIKAFGYETENLIFKEYCEKVIQELDFSILRNLSKQDDDERHIAQLRYYLEIMARCGYQYQGNQEDLEQLLISIDFAARTKEELLKALMKHRQVEYGCFYTVLRTT